MKTANLTRNEAYKAMIDGHKVRHSDLCHEKTYYFFKGESFRILDGFNMLERAMVLPFEDGYFICEPEPTFKEVTMYQTILNEKPFRIFAHLYKTKEEAMGTYPAIGYTEVKVFLKEGEDE